MYSLFRASAPPMSSLEDRSSFSPPAISTNLRARRSAEQAKLNAWADGVSEIASAAKAKGKGFVYVISPSKAAHAPQYLPAGRTCPR